MNKKTVLWFHYLFRIDGEQYEEVEFEFILFASRRMTQIVAKGHGQIISNKI